MVVWSSIFRSGIRPAQITTLLKTPATLQPAKNALQLRHMSDHGPRYFHVTASRFQWHKFKDTVHFYIMLGVLPLTALVFYCNVFIGPATLTAVPEGYTPKHWEYHKHPISRFLARYIHSSPQQDYEKVLHVIYEESERQQLRLLETKVRDKMAERNDYQAYYYRPVTAKYLRVSKEASDYLENIWGD